MYKYQNRVSRLKMFLRYKQIFILLTCCLVALLVFSLSGYTTKETALISKNGLNDTSITQNTKLKGAEKVTIEKSRTNFVIPLLLVAFGFIIFIIFTFIFPFSGNKNILDRLK